MRRWAPLILIVWITLSTITCGGMVQEFQYHHIGCEWAVQEYRRDLAFAIGWSLLPPAWIIGPFATGFYENGWGFGKRECK